MPTDAAEGTEDPAAADGGSDSDLTSVPVETRAAYAAPGPVTRPPSRQLAWTARLVLLAAVLVTVMLAALLIAMFVNDDRIATNRGVATATVLSVSPLRTGIEFVDAAGLTIRPPGGVLYPGLLSVGQQFVVEYSSVDPTIVRVAGRTASVGIVMVLLAAACTWAVAAPLVWWLRQRSGLELFSGERRLRPRAVA